MAARKTPKYPPKAVELYFDEKIPDRPPDRASREVREAPAAKARLVVEELLCRHHGASDAEIRRLDPTAQRILLRIVTEPSDRDYVYRRDAVSALAVLGSQDAVMVLASLASDKDEDPVIRGRALHGLAKVGGEVAHRLIVNSIENQSDPYVRNSAVKALLKVNSASIVPALERIAETYPSPLLRKRAQERLHKIGKPTKGKRPRIPVAKGVLKREPVR